jgi:hypothetical protein
MMEDFALFDEDGPILNEDGTQATFFELMAWVGATAREHGMELEIADGPDGQEMYRLKKADES